MERDWEPGTEQRARGSKVDHLLSDLSGHWNLFVRTRVGPVGLGIILLFLLLAAAHPILMATVWDRTTYDPVFGLDYEAESQPAAPSLRHLLGTDPLGRDILSQLMWSARSEFMLAVVAALVTVVVGTAVGALSAYFGGVVDVVLMRLADVTTMMPLISLAVVLSALFGFGLIELAVTVGALSGFGATGIVLKSQALTITVKPYVEAARSAGGGHLHMMMVHIVPNLLPLSLLYVMFTVTTAIFSEAVLSYLGLLDVRMSWGIMINTTVTKGYLLEVADFWWLVFPASLSITLLCSSFYLVGRALDEIVNPRLRQT